MLPLSSYLLKPIQRITKYQLLLKELLRHCNEDMRQEVQAALAAMLDLLTQLNSDMHQLHILGFIVSSLINRRVPYIVFYKMCYREIFVYWVH